MNKKKLRSIMQLYGDTSTMLANYIGISYQRFSYKINEKDGAEFTQKENSKIKEKYSLTPEDIYEIFFNQMVS